MTNPFFIYILTFSVALFGYYLPWSELWSGPSSSMVMFFLFSFFLMFLVGVFVNKRTVRIANSFPNYGNYERLHKYTWWILLLTIFQVFVDVDLPLFSVIFYSVDTHGKYGIPIILPFLLTMSSFLSVYVFSYYVKTKKIKLLSYFFIMQIPSILFYNRGTIMVTLFCCFFSLFYLYSNELKCRKIIFLFCFIFVICYLFGFAGNKRVGGDEVIQKVGKATEEFNSIWIPANFFWSYIYLVSPMANLNLNIEHNQPDALSPNDIFYFLCDEFVPDIISKRLISLLELRMSKQIALVNPIFNVSSVYGLAVVALGWMGMILVNIYMIFFYLFFIFILRKNNPFFFVGLCFLNASSLLNFFSDMMGQTSLFLPLCFSVVFGLLYKETYQKPSFSGACPSR